MADNTDRKLTSDSDVSDAAKQPQDLERSKVAPNTPDSRAEQTIDQATSGPSQRKQS